MVFNRFLGGNKESRRLDLRKANLLTVLGVVQLLGIFRQQGHKIGSGKKSGRMTGFYVQQVVLKHPKHSGQDINKERG